MRKGKLRLIHALPLTCAPGTRSKRVKIAHNKSKRLAVDSDGTMMVENRNKLLQNGQGGDSSDDSDGDQDASENPLVQDSSKTTRRAAMWFSQDQFAGLEDDVPDQPMPVDDVEEDKPASKANGKVRYRRLVSLIDPLG